MFLFSVNDEWLAMFATCCKLVSRMWSSWIFPIFQDCQHPSPPRAMVAQRHAGARRSAVASVQKRPQTLGHPHTPIKIEDTLGICQTRNCKLRTRKQQILLKLQQFDSRNHDLNLSTVISRNTRTPEICQTRKIKSSFWISWRNHSLMLCRLHLKNWRRPYYPMDLNWSKREIRVGEVGAKSEEFMNLTKTEGFLLFSLRIPRIASFPFIPTMG